jgi:hypothetical protein
MTTARHSLCVNHRNYDLAASLAGTVRRNNYNTCYQYNTLYGPTYLFHYKNNRHCFYTSTTCFGPTFHLQAHNKKVGCTPLQYRRINTHITVLLPCTDCAQSASCHYKSTLNHSHLNCSGVARGCYDG